MTTTAYAETNVGRVRSNNEDTVWMDVDRSIYVVADGMGGHAAGAVASQTAVQTITHELSALEDIDHAQDGETSIRERIKQTIESAIRRAGAAVYEKGRANPELRGMGTTVSMLLLTEKRGYIAHVGDSRIYLLREGDVIQMTEDHSLLNELKKQGRSLPTGAKLKKYTNAITRAVGVYPDVNVDVLDFEITGDDTFLLCTDGLSEYLTDPSEIREVIEADGLPKAAGNFVALANERGGRDNISAIVVAIKDESVQEPISESSDLTARLKTLQKMPLFQHLTYVELMEVLNLCITKSFSQGEKIFESNQPGNELYIVRQGAVVIQKDGVVLSRVGEGGHFGEMAIMDKGLRSADAYARTDCRLLEVPRKALFSLMRKDNDLAVKLLWCFVQILNRRLRTTNLDLLEARHSPEPSLAIPSLAAFDTIEQ